MDKLKARRKNRTNHFLKKEPATGAIGYLILFSGMLILVILMVYMLSAAKLITHRYEADDALADAVLAAMVIDDTYFYETGMAGEAVVRYRDRNASWNLYRDCIRAELSESDLYGNLTLSEFVLYEVEDGRVSSTLFSESGGASTFDAPIGTVTTPGGAPVTKTSAYARITFDLKSLLTNRSVSKSRDIYCRMETEGIDLPDDFFPEDMEESMESGSGMVPDENEPVEGDS